MSVYPPVLFLPGLLCDAALWQQQIDMLAPHADCQVADLTQHSSMKDLAAAALAQAPAKFSLVALSMGGYVAFEILRQAPERVARLCLMDTSARPDTPEQSERRRALIGLSKSGKFKGVTPRLLPLLIHPDRLQDENITKTIMTMAERIGPQAFERQQTAILNRVDSRLFLSKISVPTLVIGGDDDQITPPEIVGEIVQWIPGALYHRIAHCGHLPPLEQPLLVNDLLTDFLLGPQD